MDASTAITTYQMENSSVTSLLHCRSSAAAMTRMMKRTAMTSFAAYDSGVSVRGQLDVWMSRTCGDRAGRGLKRQELNTRNSLAN